MLKLTLPKKGIIDTFTNKETEEIARNIIPQLIAVKNLSLLIREVKSNQSMKSSFFENKMDMYEEETGNDKILAFATDFIDLPFSESNASYRLIKSAKMYASITSDIMLQGLASISCLKELSEKLVDLMVAPQQNEMDFFEINSRDVLSKLSYGLLSQLELKYCKNKDSDVLTGVFNACGKLGIDVIELADFARREFNENPPKVGIFEDNPDMANGFIEAFEEDLRARLYDSIAVLTKEDLVMIIQKPDLATESYIESLERRAVNENYGD